VPKSYDPICAGSGAYRCDYVLVLGQFESSTNDNSTGDHFSGELRTKMVSANGLTIIVQEITALRGSVQACAPRAASTRTNILGGPGLFFTFSNTLLFKGTKDAIDQCDRAKIQDVGGYINAYTSFDRTSVFGSTYRGWHRHCPTIG